MLNFLSISNERGHFDYPSLSQDFEWKPHVEMALTYQVLTKQCLKKVFPTSNDFVSNGSSLLKGKSSGATDIAVCRGKGILVGIQQNAEGGNTVWRPDSFRFF